MLSERRTRSLRELAQNTSEARTLESVFAATVQALAAHHFDLPFVLLYKLDEHAQNAALTDTTGIERGLASSPEELSFDGLEGISWPLSEIVERREVVQIDDLKARFGEFPGGPYPKGINTALARSLMIPGSDMPLGVIIVGVSPRLPLNDAYRNHLEQVTVAASVALGNALEYEQERKRAEALDEIDRAKTQFFANVSHEFRTPLAPMLGPIENVLSSAEVELSEENRDQIRIARRNSLRLLKLVNALLDFSRIEAGRAQATFEPTDLSSLTAELAGHFRSMIKSSGMELDVNCPALGQDIYVDREMWRRSSSICCLTRTSSLCTARFRSSSLRPLIQSSSQWLIQAQEFQNSSLRNWSSDSIASKARKGARTKEAGLAWRWWMSFRAFIKAAPPWKASWALDQNLPSLSRAAQGICRLSISWSRALVCLLP